jgi:AcrR family transcriptional regulator
MVTTEPQSIRSAIVAACERVLARTGYTRMTMADVAAEARLARRTLYLHFNTKEALAKETVQMIVGRAYAGMEGCLQAETGAQALRAMLVERIVNRLETVGAYHHSLDEILAALYPHNTQYNIVYYEKEILLVQRAIERGVADGSLRSADSREDAELLIRATNGFLPSNLSISEARDLPSVRHRLDRLAGILTAGLSLKAAKELA